MFVGVRTRANQVKIEYRESIKTTREISITKY